MGIKLLFIESGINLPYYYNFLKMSDTSDTFHFTNNEEENYELLQLLLEKCPPNEIISNKYSPDVVAKIQLMISKDSRLNNIQFAPPKPKNSEMDDYADQFNMFDYLGRHYAKWMNHIVYLKFNNSKFNTMADSKLRTKVLPAFYVPFQQIYNQQQVQFAQNMGLGFPDMNAKSYFPNVKSNRGCSLDPIFCSTYESGNLFAAIRKNPFKYDLLLQSDVNSCESVGWFNFSVQFLEEGYYTFQIVNMTYDMSKLFQNGLKISYFHLNSLNDKPLRRVGEDWGLCGQNIKFSRSSIDRQNKQGQQYYELRFEYKCKNKHDIIMFALDLPYSTMESAKFYDRILLKKMRGMISVEKIEYGRTLQGSPLNSIVITRKKSGDSVLQKTRNSEGSLQRRFINLSPLHSKCQSMPDSRNKSIIIIGRLNGIDTSSSFSIEGMVEYLFENNEFDSLKKTYNFYLIPFANVDGVKYGNAATNLTGSNLNGNWKSPSKDYQPQIYYLKEYINSIHKNFPISLIVNLTGEQNEIFSSIVSVKNNTDECEDSRVFPFIFSKRNRIISFQNCVFMDKNANNSMCCVLNDLYPKALIYQFNISHFKIVASNEDQSDDSQEVIPSQLGQCDAQSYRLFGRDLISNYLQHVKLNEKNCLLKDKWSKEIHELEGKITRKTIDFIEDTKTESRFLQQFYTIPQRNQPIVTVSNSTSIHSQNKKQIGSPVVSSRYLKIKKGAPQPFEAHSSNDLLKRNEVYLKSTTEFFANIKEEKNEDGDQGEQDQANKLPHILRLTRKKTSILKKYSPNSLSLLENSSTANSRSKKLIAQFGKEIIKKQLPVNNLRKVKIEQLKGKAKPQKMGQISLVR